MRVPLQGIHIQADTRRNTQTDPLLLTADGRRSSNAQDKYLRGCTLGIPDERPESELTGNCGHK